jgi:hypothetical protein
MFLKIHLNSAAQFIPVVMCAAPGSGDSHDFLSRLCAVSVGGSAMMFLHGAARERDLSSTASMQWLDIPSTSACGLTSFRTWTSGLAARR